MGAEQNRKGFMTILVTGRAGFIGGNFVLKIEILTNADNLFGRSTCLFYKDFLS